MGNSQIREKSHRANDSTEDYGPTIVAPNVQSEPNSFTFLKQKSEGNSSTATNILHQRPKYGEGGEMVESMVSVGSPQATNIRVGIDINARKLPTVFRWTGGGKSCFLSGSFDNWSSLVPLVKSVNDFFTIIELPEGTYQYKYLIDNQWVCDNNQDKVPNSFGTHNNVISVRSSDFEVFEALGTDSIATGQMNSKSHDRPDSPAGEYGQHIPAKESSYHGVKHTFPPILPPHLLQVILNKEVPLHCEPSLLPEPNHVMLNHLYALSIKDGVMVLSTTHRYRKKYVTTLIYKPI